jgi:hypothetical protein
MDKAEAVGLVLLAYLALILVMASDDVRMRQEACVATLGSLRK